MADETIHIRPRDLLRKAVTKLLVSIKLRGTSKRRLVYVLETMNQYYYDRGDLWGAWEQGCAVADARSEDVLQIPESCMCNEESSKSTFHLCSLCTSLTFCSRMIMDLMEGTRRCDICNVLVMAQDRG